MSNVIGVELDPTARKNAGACLSWMHEVRPNVVTLADVLFELLGRRWGRPSPQSRHGSRPPTVVVSAKLGAGSTSGSRNG
jgi:hypothetical protein